VETLERALRDLLTAIREVLERELHGTRGA
jgi:hypothetical protein